MTDRNHAKNVAFPYDPKSGDIWTQLQLRYLAYRNSSGVWFTRVGNVSASPNTTIKAYPSFPESDQIYVRTTNTQQTTLPPDPPYRIIELYVGGSLCSSPVCTHRTLSAAAAVITHDYAVPSNTFSYDWNFGGAFQVLKIEDGWSALYYRQMIINLTTGNEIFDRDFWWVDNSDEQATTDMAVAPKQMSEPEKPGWDTKFIPSEWQKGSGACSPGDNIRIAFLIQFETRKFYAPSLDAIIGLKAIPGLI